MFIEIEDLDISKRKFSKNGLPILDKQASLYVNLYRSVLHRHFGLIRNIKLTKIDYNISEYTRFHLLPLMLDSGVKPVDALFFLDIDEEKIELALTNYSEDNLWHTSNIHMGALAAVSVLKKDHLFNLANQLIKNLDVKRFTSNNWKYKGCINRIATFYHYIPFIDRYNINICKRTKEILYKDLKALQNSLGSFCSPNGFSCIELDSVVVAAYLNKFSFDINEILKKKLFNHLSNFDNGWPLYGFSYGYFNEIIDVFYSSSLIQDKLWNFKKIFFDIHKLQFDNGHKELASRANDKTLMSNYFGLITYIQLIKTLDIIEKNNLQIFDSHGLSYVIE